MKRSPLKRPTLAQVQAWQRKPRKPIAQIGRRAKRETAALAEFRRVVHSRSRGMCEVPELAIARTSIICGESDRHVGFHAHHVLSRGRGGSHDPANGLLVCPTAHHWIHTHPEAAERLGLLRSGR